MRNPQKNRQQRTAYTWRQFLLVFLAGAVIFFLMRGFAVGGGDTNSINFEWKIWAARLTYYVREPLGTFLPMLPYWLTGNVALSFQLSSAFFGGFYLALLPCFSRKPVFLAINLLTALTMNFVGHLEYYAPVIVALTLYFLLLTRALEAAPRARPWQVAAAWGLAFLCHKMAIIYGPVMLWLAVERDGGRWRLRPWKRRELDYGVAVIVGFILLDLLPVFLKTVWYRFPMYVVTRDDSIWELITPLTLGIGRAISARSTTGVYFLYSVGQLLHWKYFLFFWLISAPLGIPALAGWLWRHGWRGLKINDRALALASASLIAVIWTFFWHPHMGFWDWDLFDLGALPLNLLAGGLWAGIFPE